MASARPFRTAFNRIVPFLLAGRMLTLTSSASLGVLLQLQGVDTAYAADHAVVAAQPLNDTDFLAATNAARVAAGIAPLRLDVQLEHAAMAKAIDMKEFGYWDHFRPSDHKAPWDFIDEAGYTYRVAGENLARGFHSVQAITTAWLNSPAHRANLLSPKYTDVGFADIEGTDENGNPALFTVQMFASR